MCVRVKLTFGVVLALATTWCPVSSHSEYLLPPPAPYINDSDIVDESRHGQTSHKGSSESAAEAELEVEMIVTIHRLNELLNEYDAHYYQSRRNTPADLRHSSKLLSVLRRVVREAPEEDVCLSALLTDGEKQAWFQPHRWTRLYHNQKQLATLPMKQIGKPVLCTLNSATGGLQPITLFPNGKHVGEKSMSAKLCVSDPHSQLKCNKQLGEVSVYRCSEDDWVYKLESSWQNLQHLSVCPEDSSRKTEPLRSLLLQVNFPETMAGFQTTYSINTFIDYVHEDMEHLSQESYGGFGEAIVVAENFSQISLRRTQMMIVALKYPHSSFTNTEFRKAVETAAEYMKKVDLRIVIQTPLEQRGSETADSNLASDNVLKAHRGLFIVVAIVVGVAVLLVVIFLLIMYCIQRRRGQDAVMKASVLQVSEDGSPTTMRRVQEDRKAAVAMEKKQAKEAKEREKLVEKERHEELKKQQNERKASQLAQVQARKQAEKDRKDSLQRAKSERKEQEKAEAMERKNREKQEAEERKKREKQEKEVKKEAARARKRAEAQKKVEKPKGDDLPLDNHESTGLAARQSSEEVLDGVDNPVGVVEEEMLASSVQMQESGVPGEVNVSAEQEEGWVVPIDQLLPEDNQPDDVQL